MDWLKILIIVYLLMGIAVSTYEMVTNRDIIEEDEIIFGFYCFLFLWPYVLYKEFKQK
jgi:hypothetical protein